MTEAPSSESAPEADGAGEASGPPDLRDPCWMPGKGAVTAAGVLAGASAAALWLPASIAAPVLGAGWAVLVVAAVAAGRRLRRECRAVSVRLDGPTASTRGESLPARYTFVYDGAAPLRLVFRPILPELGEPRAQTAPLRLAPGETRELTLEIQANVRGDYHFGDVYLRATDALGLVRLQWRAPAGHLCAIQPDIRRVREFLNARGAAMPNAPHVRTSRFRGMGNDFESLRDYEYGDDIRRIDWKATAKHSRLITRNYEIEHFRNIMIVLDRGRLMGAEAGNGTKLDHAIDAALMVAGAALGSGDQCGLLVFDHDVTAYLPPKGGLRQLTAMASVLAPIQPTLAESHFRRAFMYLQTRLTKRSLILLIGDIADSQASQALVTGALTLGRRHLMVMSALRTPDLEAILATPDKAPVGPYRKAVVYRLRRERRELLGRLQKGGVHILDVHPEDLTVPAVNKYVELREMNLL